MPGRHENQRPLQESDPLVRFVNGPSGPRAAIIGTGLDVWEIIATLRDNDNDVAEAASYLSVPRDVIDAAVNYYGKFPDQIDSEIAANQAAGR